MLEVLNASSVRKARPGQDTETCAESLIDFGFANALSFKDVRLCLDEAEALGVPMVVGAAGGQMPSDD